MPVLMQTPPTTSWRSTSITRLPSLAAWMAARWPAGPDPIATRSKSYAMRSPIPDPGIATAARQCIVRGAGLSGRPCCLALDAKPLRVLRHIRVPAALPALTSGLRVAAAVAPIGAVVGEWVGSSGGLGYIMLHANARMQVDLMFAALLILAAMALALWLAVDRGGRALTRWQPDSSAIASAGVRP